MTKQLNRRERQANEWAQKFQHYGAKWHKGNASVNNVFCSQITDSTHAITNDRIQSALATSAG